MSLRSRLPLVAALLATAVLAAHGQPIDPTVGGDIRIDQRLDEQVPLDLTFRDETGASVQLADLVTGERPVILSLVYYECPMLCTQVLNGLLRTLRALSLDVGSDFDIVTVSIDPDETAELAQAKKQEYVSRYRRSGAAGGWHFLTGDAEAVEQLAEAVGFRYEYDEEEDLYVHASGIMVLTPKGRLARYFYGIEYSVKDLRLGLVEASQNRIGSPVDQMLLLCYQYDPATGKYGLAIINTVRVAGGATVAIMAFLIVGWVRRDRRTSPPSPNVVHRN